MLIAAGIGRGESRFIFTPEGDVTIETVEPTSSGGVEIRELYIYEDISGNITELTEEQKAWNIGDIRTRSTKQGNSPSYSQRCVIHI